MGGGKLTLWAVREMSANTEAETEGSYEACIKRLIELVGPRWTGPSRYHFILISADRFIGFQHYTVVLCGPM